jgi:hypothetical protein
LNPGSVAKQNGIQVLEGLPETGAFLLLGGYWDASRCQGLTNKGSDCLPLTVGGVADDLQLVRLKSDGEQFGFEGLACHGSEPSRQGQVNDQNLKTGSW